MDAAASFKDIEDLFASGVTPLLDSFLRVEKMVMELHRRMDDSPRNDHSGASNILPQDTSRDALEIAAEETAANNDINDFLSPESKAETPSAPEAQDVGTIQGEVDQQAIIEGSKGKASQSPDPVESRTASNASIPFAPGVSETYAHRVMVQREMAALHGSEGHERKAVTLALRILAWWHKIKEPPRSGCMFSLLKSRVFENLCMLTILINSVFVAYVADWEMKSFSDEKPVAFFRMEVFFNSFFVVELTLKLIVHRLYYFFNQDGSWNCFDFVLVAFTVLDMVLTAALPEGGETANVGFMRILRLMRLAKIIRAFKTVRFFKELSILAESFRRSLFTLFWGVALLVLTTFIFSLVFLQALSDYAKEDTTDAQAVSAIHQYFGSLGRTMLSLYMAVTGGDDWSLYYDIVSSAGPFYAGVFVMFTFFFMFALFNILTGMLVEKAVAASALDRNDLVLQKRQKNREDADELLRMCRILDQDGNGTISRQEFENMLQNSVFDSYMSTLGLDVSDSQLFFSTIAGSPNSGELAVEDFADACVHMRGGATSVDMKRQLLESSKLLSKLQSSDSKNSKALARMEAQNSRIVTMISHVCKESRLPQKTKISESRSSL